MPFDASTSDYFETKPAPVAVPLYDKDNPPPTMAEAIRMAVADVEAQERAGVQYEWGDCARCTAGAVVRRLGGKGGWGSFGARWNAVLSCLSHLTVGWCGTDMAWAFHPESSFGYYWNEAEFGPLPSNVAINVTRYETNPTAFKRDMLALADRLEREAAQ